MKIKLSIIFIFLFNIILSQEKKIIQIIEAGSFDKNEIKLPGANILKKSNSVITTKDKILFNYKQRKKKSDPGLFSIFSTNPQL